MELNIYTKKKTYLLTKLITLFLTYLKNINGNFILFQLYLKFSTKKSWDFPKRVLLKYYDKDGMINVEFNFYSNRYDLSFNHYIPQPKPMLETLLIKNLDKYPEKLKMLEYSKAPYYEYLILKYYGFGMIDHYNRLVFCIRGCWLNNTPTDPNNDFKEILRNI